MGSNGSPPCELGNNVLPFGIDGPRGYKRDQRETHHRQRRDGAEEGVESERYGGKVRIAPPGWASLEQKSRKSNERNVDWRKQIHLAKALRCGNWWQVAVRCHSAFRLIKASIPPTFGRPIISCVVKRILNSFSIAVMRLIWDNESHRATSAAVMVSCNTMPGSSNTRWKMRVSRSCIVWSWVVMQLLPRS